MSEDTDLIRRLNQIAEHDWRISTLAHTADTAAEAVKVLRGYSRRTLEEAQQINRYADIDYHLRQALSTLYALGRK